MGPEVHHTQKSISLRPKLSLIKFLKMDVIPRPFHFRSCFLSLLTIANINYSILNIPGHRTGRNGVAFLCDTTRVVLVRCYLTKGQILCRHV
jgi:hypothetical protein